jgi:hypothetical protein
VDTTTTAGRYTLKGSAATATCPTSTAAYVADLGKISDNVTLLSQTLTDDTHWCIAVQNLKGDKQQFKYSAKNGLAQGDCVAGDTT